MEAKRIIYKNEERIRVDFPYNIERIKQIKTIEGSRWSMSLKSWHLPYSKKTIKELKLIFSDITIVDIFNSNDRIKKEVTIEVIGKRIELKAPKNEYDIKFIRSFDYARWQKHRFLWIIPNYKDNIDQIKHHFKNRIASIEYRKKEMPIVPDKIKIAKKLTTKKVYPKSIEALNELRIWMQHKRYSDSTISSYIDSLQKFFAYSLPKKHEDINAQDLVNYVHGYIIPNNLSYAIQNHTVSASKIFFREIVNANFDVEQFHRPKAQKRLPNVLSKEEVKGILDAIKNQKHKAMLSLIYACGLRRSELLNLKASHIESKRGLVIIKQGKGKKDRIVPISEKTIEMLRAYFKTYQPKVWLFEGQNNSVQYSAESLSKILKKACTEAKINKPVTLHWLRHSYATHLLENGTDIRYIQELLGHSSSKTTEIYTHVSTKNIQQIKSPFDDL